jgi:hypothetical protein
MRIIIDMRRNSEPNVNTSQTDKNRLVSHVKKLVSEKPDITDSEMRHELTNFLQNDRSTGYSNTDEYYRRHNHRGTMDIFNPLGLMRITPFFDTRQIMREMNNTWAYMNKTFSELKRELPQHDVEENENNSYVKYVSSVTSYDHNGQKKTKSVSGVEKIKDGKKTVHKKMTTHDENGTTVEEIYPDGTKKITTKANDNKMLQ